MSVHICPLLIAHLPIISPIILEFTEYKTRLKFCMSSDPARVVFRRLATITLKLVMVALTIVGSMS